MNGADSIWDKLTRVVIGLLFVAALVAVGVWYLPLIQQNERMRREVMRLEALVQQEAETKRHLTSTVEALSTDPRAVERLAREKLGYAKPGETVIKFEELNTNATVRP